MSETGISPFVPEGEQSSHLLAVALEGQFTSFYAGQASPLLNVEEEADDEDESASSQTSEEVELGPVSAVIEKSPESARLIVIGSNDFAADQILQMMIGATGTAYNNPTQLMINVVDWSVEDQSLIGIRSRGNFNRTLPPMEQADQALIEYLNYFLALISVFAVMFYYRTRQKRKMEKQSLWLNMDGGVR